MITRIMPKRCAVVLSVCAVLAIANQSSAQPNDLLLPRLPPPPPTAPSRCDSEIEVSCVEWCDGETDCEPSSGCNCGCPRCGTSTGPVATPDPSGGGKGGRGVGDPREISGGVSAPCAVPPTAIPQPTATAVSTATARATAVVTATAVSTPTGGFSCETGEFVETCYPWGPAVCTSGGTTVAQCYETAHVIGPNNYFGCTCPPHASGRPRSYYRGSCVSSWWQRDDGTECHNRF